MGDAEDALNSRSGTYLGEVVVHRFLDKRVVFAPFETHLGHLPEPRGGQIHAVEVGSVSNRFHTGVSAELCPVRLQSGIELVAGILDCHAVEIASRRSCRWSCIRCIVCGVVVSKYGVQGHI
jgi:hypothetical protein